MYCPECGSKNQEDSEYCEKCGSKINKEVSKILPQDNVYVDYSDHYVISSLKLVVMSVCTLGLYPIYWFYRQEYSFDTNTGTTRSKIRAFMTALFSPLTAYYLFKKVLLTDDDDKKKGKSDALGLALAYFFLSQLWLGFIPLIFVQKKINSYWIKKLNNQVRVSKFGVWNWIILISFLMLILYGINSEDNYNSTKTSTNNNSEISKTNDVNYKQEEVASSVVNILCENSVQNNESSGGSGTILSEEGVILTNSHIIPQDKDNILVGDKGCLVVLPDSITGQPKNIYWAKPIVIPEISEKYDLAYVSIDAPYYDESGKQYGEYPRKFPAFSDVTRCTSEELKLGESVRIFGYPAISGGYTLTITDGLISSFPGDGLIVTSAKISHGNSGGLAVDKNGCMVGVPSLVNSDENESLGVIYSMELINKFVQEVSKYLDHNESN